MCACVSVLTTYRRRCTVSADVLYGAINRNAHAGVVCAPERDRDERVVCRQYTTYKTTPVIVNVCAYTLTHQQTNQHIHTHAYSDVICTSCSLHCVQFNAVQIASCNMRSNEHTNTAIQDVAALASTLLYACVCVCR